MRLTLANHRMLPAKRIYENRNLQVRVTQNCVPLCICPTILAVSLTYTYPMRKDPLLTAAWLSIRKHRSLVNMSLMLPRGGSKYGDGSNERRGHIYIYIYIYI